MPITNLTIVDEPAPATWSEAKKLVEKVRSGARAWLQLGVVLEALRTEFLSKGGRPKNSPHDAASSDERGWQAKVREELGISDDTARRWMLDAQRYKQIIQISDGGTHSIDGKKITNDVRERAQEALTALQADPSVRPARMWAGLWGSGATKGKQRAQVDHARNIARALTALETSLPHWAELKPEERAILEHAWAKVRDLIPSTFPQ